MYTKEEMQQHLCFKWDRMIKEQLNEVLKKDPYNIEDLHSHEYLSRFIDMTLLTENPLFQRKDIRINNTNLADFLHGHCLRFQNFAFSYLKADKSMHAPLCLECCMAPDSVHHKVFECSMFDSEHRNYLQEKVGSLEHNFHLAVIFAKPEDRKELQASLSCQIDHICQSSSFKDDLLIQPQRRRNQNQNMMP